MSALNYVKFLIKNIYEHQKSMNKIEYAEEMRKLLSVIKTVKEEGIKLEIFTLGYSKCELLSTKLPVGNTIEHQLNLKVIKSEDYPPDLEEIPSKECKCQGPNDICKKTDLKELFKCKNFKRFLSLNHNLRNLFNKDILFRVVIVPGFNLTCDYDTFVSNVENLFDLLRLQYYVHERKSYTADNWHHRIVLLVCIMDFLLENYFYATLFKNYYVNAYYELQRVHGFNPKYYKKNGKYGELEFLKYHSLSTQVWFKWLKTACIEIK